MYNRRKKIKELRKALEKGSTIGDAMRLAGIGSSETLFRWKRQSNLGRLAKLIEAAKALGQSYRDDMVEDAQFKHLMEGTASGSEYIFYLTNRRPERWKKVTELGFTAGPPALLKSPIINYISFSAQDKTS